MYPSAGPYRIVSREPGSRSSSSGTGTTRATGRRTRTGSCHGQHRPGAEPAAGARRSGRPRPGRRPRDGEQPLSNEFGVNKSRYFVNPLVGTQLHRAQHRLARRSGRSKARQARQLRGRPARDAAHARQVRWRTHRPDPRSALPGFGTRSLPAQGCGPARAKQLAGNRVAKCRLPAHHVSRCGRQAQIAQVQPRADGLQGQPEAAAVRRRHQHDGHEGQRHRRLLHRLDRGLLRSVRLHQRPPGRHATSRTTNNNNYSYWNNAEYNS